MTLSPNAERAGIAMFAIGVVALCWGVSYCSACAPQGTAKRQAEDQVFITLEKGACVIIKAEDPNLDGLCATLDELAPLVPQIMAKRSADAGVDSTGD
jgi:hypothetical protein